MLGLLRSFVTLGLESTVSGRKLRNTLGENETVNSYTFREIVGANTGFNLSDLISFVGLLVISTRPIGLCNILIV